MPKTPSFRPTFLLALSAFVVLSACTSSGFVPGSTPGPSEASDDPTPAARPCGPVIVHDTTHPVEGRTIEGELRCSLREDRGGLEFALASATARPTLDPGTARWTWTPGASDVGHHEIVATVHSIGSSGLPESTTLTLDVADDGSGQSPPDPESYREEWGLPVLHLFPTAKLSSEYGALDLVFDGVRYPAAIKKRGASSLGYPKNSFTLRFDEVELDADRLGMGNLDRLVLVSTFDDASYVRQKLSYDTWAAMAEAQGADRLRPRANFVVLYLDGRHHGLYVSLDHIDDDFGEENGIPEDANLYKAVSHDANFRRTDSGGGPKSWLGQGLDKKEGPDDDWSDLDALVAFVADVDADQFHEQADEHLIPEEFMDWFLFVHWTRAQDSAGKNAYLFHAAGQPFRYVPWDLNHSFGQGWYPYAVSWDGEDSFSGNNRVFERFHQDPRWSQAMWARHQDLVESGPFNEQWMREELAAAYALIEPHADRDWSRWGGEYRSYFGMGTVDWREDFDAVEQWVSDRAAWEAETHSGP